ncbi:MAG: Crp/Fnr family transcriptional regulator [Casimicrobiaceae bacterium]
MTEVATIFEALAAKAATKRELSPGEALFRVGDRVKAVYVIATGRLRLIRTSTRGGEVTLHRAKAGESFAEASLFSERYHCNAVAEVASEVLAYPKTRIINGFVDHPERLMVLLRHLGAQVQALRARAEILSLHAATDRLMAYFSLHMPQDGDVLAIDSTWKQIATEIGLSHEALYRALARLDDSGVIERDGSKVRLTAR